ncbi:MAG: hypothetical protein GY708_09500, partial [Actinomycetia bacterium]|nr:hypothetical protein [Actinomycetes bacterium]
MQNKRIAPAALAIALAAVGCTQSPHIGAPVDDGRPDVAAPVIETAPEVPDPIEEQPTDQEPTSAPHNPDEVELTVPDDAPPAPEPTLPDDEGTNRDEAGAGDWEPIVGYEYNDGSQVGILIGEATNATDTKRDQILDFIPPSYHAGIGAIDIFPVESGIGGAVGPFLVDGEPNGEWAIGLTLFDDDALVPLVHEVGHIVMYIDGIEWDTTECGDRELFPNGCATPDSALGSFIDTFWGPNASDDNDAFVTDYASVHPAEDAAESRTLQNTELLAASAAGHRTVCLPRTRRPWWEAVFGRC